MNLKVVTVVKNDLSGLRRTELSISGQSIPVIWSLVTPNDGSQTFEHAQHLLNTGIVGEILLDKHHGVYPAMNQAITSAHAEDWLWFLNAGDEFADFKTYQLVSQYGHSSTNVWLYGGHFLGSHSGKILGEVKAPRRFKPANQLFAKKYVSHQSTIFRAKFLQDLGGFDTNLKIAADWDLMVRASKIDPGLKIPESLSIFYMGGLSTAARQMGNIELFQIRRIHLGLRYSLKNYWWFGYRWLRNKFVQSFEGRFPSSTDSVRRFRLGVKNFDKTRTSKGDIF